MQVVERIQLNFSYKSFFEDIFIRLLLQKAKDNKIYNIIFIFAYLYASCRYMLESCKVYSIHGKRARAYVYLCARNTAKAIQMIFPFILLPPAIIAVSLSFFYCINFYTMCLFNGTHTF